MVVAIIVIDFLSWDATVPASASVPSEDAAWPVHLCSLICVSTVSMGEGI